MENRLKMGKLVRGRGIFCLHPVNVQTLFNIKAFFAKLIETNSPANDPNGIQYSKASWIKEFERKPKSTDGYHL